MIGGRPRSGVNGMRDLLDSVLSPHSASGRQREKRETAEPLKGWMAGLMPAAGSNRHGEANKLVPAALASRLPHSDEGAVGKDRPASVAFQSLSDLLDLGTPRPSSSAARVPVVEAPIRPPPPASQVLKEKTPQNRQRAALSPRSPESESRFSVLDDQQGRPGSWLIGHHIQKGETDEPPIQPWAVYSPINEPEQTAELRTQPRLSMSYRHSAGGKTAGEEPSIPQDSWVADKESPGFDSTRDGIEEEPDKIHKQLQVLRQRINELEAEIAACHFAAGQGLNTVARRGELKVRNLSLGHLPRMDMFGKCYPVVELTIGQQRRRTRRRAGCLEASFEDEVISFRFPCPDSELNAGLVCQVWDTNRTHGDKIVGMATFDLLPIANGPRGNYTQRFKTTLRKDLRADASKIVGHDSQETEVQMELSWESSLGDDEGLQTVLRKASEASCHISALNQVIEQSESQMAYLQQSDTEKSLKIAHLETSLRHAEEAQAKALLAEQHAAQSEKALQICNKKLEALTEAAETALEANEQDQHQLFKLYEEKAQVGSAVGAMLSELIEAKREVRQIINREKTVHTRCTQLELELAGLRSQMRKSFVGYNKETSELDAELTRAMEVKEELEQNVAELSAQIDELKLQLLKQRAQQKTSGHSACEDCAQAQARQQSLKSQCDKLQQGSIRMQQQNEVLHKQAAKQEEQIGTLISEVERLAHVERTMRSLQRDHDDLLKVQVDSKRQMEELRKQQELASSSTCNDTLASISRTSAPAPAAQPYAKGNSSTLDVIPRDYLLGVNIASRDDQMTVKSFAPGSVCGGILREGDQLLSIDGRRIRDVKHLRQICRGVQGTIVSIKYTREPSEEVMEMQLVRTTNTHGQPVFREYIPCTPRAQPPNAAVANAEAEAKLKMLESKWEYQMQEVLAAKAQYQKDLSAAMKDVREAQKDAEQALALLSQVQNDLAQTQGSEAAVRGDLAEARSKLEVAEAAIRRLQEDSEVALEERKVFEQEKVSLLSKLTLMQAKLNIAVKSSNNTSSQTPPCGVDAPGALPIVQTTEVGAEVEAKVEAGDLARQGRTSSLAEDPEASSLQVSKLIAENNALVEARKIKTREIDALQGKLFALEERLKDEAKRTQAAEAMMSKMTRERGAWEETFAAQEKQIKRLVQISGQQAADADTAAAARIEQLEAEVQKLLQELEACNDLLEQEWSKNAEQAEIMASLAADVTRWQGLYEELEARGIDKMFVRSSVDMSALVIDGTLSGELIESQVQEKVQEQVASVLKGALSKMNGLESDKQRLLREQQKWEREIEQAKLDKDVLDRGLDEAMKELRQQSQQLSVARSLAAEARDLAAQEALRARTAEEKMAQESSKLRIAQADINRLSLSLSRIDMTQMTGIGSAVAPTHLPRSSTSSASVSPVSNPVTLF